MKKTNSPDIFEEKYLKYLRVSVKEQGISGLGLKAQSRMIDTFVSLRPGAKVVRTIEEIYSGTKLSKCLGLQEAVRYCKENKVKLIVYNTDRFRDLKGTLDILETLGESNVVACDTGFGNGLTVRLKILFAEDEAKQISRRTKAAFQQIKDEIAKNGFYVTKGGRMITRLGTGSPTKQYRGGGYDEKMRTITNPDYIKAREAIMTMRDEGESIRKIAETLTALEYRTRRGTTRWYYEQVRRIINRQDDLPVENYRANYEEYSYTITDENGNQVTKYD